jgi:hypothetical protein
MQAAGIGLPDTSEPVVDLFAAETAACLAWAAYLLAAELDQRSPQVVLRMRREIDGRILTPCLERNDFGWMGFCGGRMNNWNPWINSNWLACSLLVESSPARRIRAVAKSLRSLDCFIRSCPADGGCDEGPTYWTRAAGSLFDCLEILYWASGGRINVYNEPLIREMGRFIYRVHLGGNWALNFADAPAATTPPIGLVYRYGLRIRDRAMQSFAAHCRARATEPAAGIPDNPTRSLPALFSTRGLSSTSCRAPLPRDVWLPDIQVMVARSTAGSARGLTLAAKGGHNAESHNHNDVGHFVVYADGNPVLVDIGVETYSRKTFSSERYGIWTMQSQYHNLPTINGVMQQNGPQFRARRVAYRADGREAVFSLDIARAYPAKARLKFWRRTCELVRNGPVKVQDEFETRGKPSAICWAFVTPCRVRMGKGRILFLATPLPHGLSSGKLELLFDARRFLARVETIRVTDSQLRGVWGLCLRRVVLRSIRPQTRERFSFCLRQR